MIFDYDGLKLRPVFVVKRALVGCEHVDDYDGLKLRPVWMVKRALVGCEHVDGGGMQSCDDCELFEGCQMLDMGEARQGASE